MGWATWSTDDVAGLLDFCNETEVMSVADALVSSGMRDLGYNRLMIDDCWAAHTRDSQDNLQPDPTRFPSGIPALVEYVHSKGLLIGLYTCAGERTCKFNRTGSGGHYAQDAQWFASMNVDMVKMDNCGAPKEPPAVYFGNFSAALNATGHPMWFSVCEWGLDAPWEWAPAIAQSYRSGPDHLPFWSYDDHSFSSGQGIVEVISHQAAVNSFSGPFAWSDADFLEGFVALVTDDESQTEFAAWAIFGGPLFIASDPRNMSAARAAVYMNAEVIGVAQDLTAPGARLFFDNSSNLQAWAKPLASGARAALLINSGDLASAAVAITWEMFGWSSSDAVAVYDLLAHAELGNFTAGYSRSLRPHASAMLRLARL